MNHENMKLIDLKKLRPHEEIDPVALQMLSGKIIRDGYWMTPVIIDKDTGIIMDGHHRYNFAVQFGLSIIPCYELSYSSGTIQVYDWKSGAIFPEKKIIEHVNAGKAFPPKTTRHVFDIIFDPVKVELTSLY
ncbi:hypothetical protein [Enterobacter asburiae]|jgi:hypothetical protein|uniref:hypothetical protein n=1 Tax=Enterobacter asburiae TaxID=61645 RepID=UPI0007E50226|nr:hypothetical protein [Enterobacter asburiae]OAY20230.1 hypothetical protein AXY04_04690 [Enterobacter asburiae]